MLGWLPRTKINLAASQTVHQEDQKQKPAGEEEREEKEGKHKCIFSIGDLLGTSALRRKTFLGAAGNRL